MNLEERNWALHCAASYKRRRSRSGIVSVETDVPVMNIAWLKPGVQDAAACGAMKVQRIFVTAGRNGP